MFCVTSGPYTNLNSTCAYVTVTYNITKNMDNLSVMFPERQYVGKPSRVPGVKNIHLKFFDRQIRIRCHDII